MLKNCNNLIGVIKWFFYLDVKRNLREITDKSEIGPKLLIINAEILGFSY